MHNKSYKQLENCLQIITVFDLFFLVFEPKSLWHHRDPVKCEVAPIKHAPEECNGRSKDYMKFRGKLGRKDETEVCYGRFDNVL